MWRAVMGSRPKRRIERHGPSIASGGMMAFTREPSARRASTMGDDSSTRRPTRETIRSIICIRCWSSLKLRPVGSSLPARSTYTLSWRLTRMSEMLGSLSRGSSGPRPKISSRISRASRSRSAKLRGTASLLTVLRIRSSTSSRAALLGVRPNFSRSRRSRILRWRSALTCWYSVRSKVCKFAMIQPKWPA